MLMDFDKGGRAITTVPFQKEYQLWQSRLTPKQWAAIEAHTDAILAGDRVHCSSWICGDDWRNTPLQPIYEKATKYSETQAAMCWGLVVMDRILHRCNTLGEDWGSLHSEDVADGRIYWKLK